MASNVAPPKSTGGGGFTFENQVCAWLLASMLADEPPLDVGLDRLDRIDFQTRPEGWFLDDALLTFRTGGHGHRCALSIKSNLQFAGYSAPEDFVRVIWEQFLHEHSTAFNEKSDLMGLASPHQNPETGAALNALVSKAGAIDPPALAERMATPGWTNEAERVLFLSFSCPSELGLKHGVSVRDTGRVLRSLRFVPFDFDSVISEYQKSSLRLCRAALRSGDLEEAAKLWEALLQVADNLRPKSGGIDRNGLVDRLRTRFGLNDHPDFRTDWARLIETSRNSAAQVSNQISSRVRLNRDAVIDKLEREIQPYDGLVILGASGVGKSAAARLWLELRASQGGKTLWFDGASFERPDFASLESNLQLSHRLSEVLNSLGDADALLVLDGLDRIYKPDAIRLVATLCRLLRLASAGGPWRIAVTCQTQEWSRLQNDLDRAGIQASTWRTFDIPKPDSKELALVGAQIPGLAKLLGQERLVPVLSNMKILDLVARRTLGSVNIEAANWHGESDVANWFWDSEVGRGSDGLMRVRFALLLGELQADDLKSHLQVDRFQVPELQPLGGLLADAVCRQTSEGLVGFAHDLYGDWARLRILVSRAHEISAFLKTRLASPMWHRAVRLYGLHLLEHLNDIGQWRSLLGEWSGLEWGVAHDLLLESPIFAVQPRRLLDAVLPDLLANEGKLLKRLLSRFLAYATRPDHNVATVAKSEGFDDGAVRTKYRYPNWSYWPAVLSFLHANLKAVVPAAPIEVSRIVEMWLNHVPRDLKVLRREASELGLALGQKAHEEAREFGGGLRGSRDLLYRVALLAADELPDEAAAFALKASERLPEFQPSDKTNAEQKALPKSLVMDSRFDPDELAPEPWPDGPHRRVEEDFRTVVLDSPALIPLIRMRPKIAREVALAVLITPRKRFAWHSHRLEDGELDIESGHRWLPAFYVHGPFLVFLRLNFAEGLELIARLIDFASQRWFAFAEREAAIEAQQAEHGEHNDPVVEQVTKATYRRPCTLAVEIGGARRELIGDERVFGWSAGLGYLPPQAVQAALMALEEYFYEGLNNGKTIDHEVQTALDRLQSVAFLKVLCDIGKRHSSLFEGPLRALLSIPEVYRWDLATTFHGRMHLMMSLGTEGPLLSKLGREFHELPHRKRDLRDLAAQLLFNRPEMKDFFDGVRHGWEERVKVSPDDPLREFLQQLILRIDSSNYEPRPHPTYGTVLVNVRLEQLAREQANERRAWEVDTRILTLPMTCRELIEKKQALRQGEVEPFWLDLQRIATRNSSSAARDTEVQLSPDDLAAAVAGGIAVLVCLHPAWLADDSVRVAWCRERIKEFVLKPPQRERFDSPRSLSTWSWDCFAADAVPVLWGRAPTDGELRQLVALLAFGVHYKAVEILFRRCADIRSVIDLDFGRLRRLVFEWAFVRYRIEFMQHCPPSLELLKKSDVDEFECQVDRWIQEHVAAFVNAQSPTVLQSWTELDDTVSFSTIDNAMSANRRDRQFDLHLVQASHAWMPPLQQATSPFERREWIQFWREGLAYVLHRAAKATDKARNHHPYEDELWVLKGAASALAHMAPTEDPEVLVNAVLSLPPEAHAWPEHFWGAFHRAGLSANPTPENYSRILRAICDKVLPSNGPPAIKWLWYEEVWDTLVGLDYLTQMYWQPRHEVLVQSMSDILERWLTVLPFHGRRISLFARWLLEPPAASIRVRAIVWLNRVVENGSKKTRDWEDAGDDLASLLDGAWRMDENRIRGDTAGFSAFKILLRLLADDRNERALELLGRLGSLG